MIGRSFPGRNCTPTWFNKIFYLHERVELVDWSSETKGFAGFHNFSGLGADRAGSVFLAKEQKDKGKRENRKLSNNFGQ